MIITLVFISSIMLLSGCNYTYMTNDEIIEETKKCEDSGMSTRQTINGFNGKVHLVHCRPRK